MFTKRSTWLLAIVATAVLAVVLAAACSDSGDSPAEPPTPTADQSIDLSGLVITMSRGACFGVCPSYAITIREDASVEYNGRSNVEVVGIRRDEIELDDVRRLIQRLEETRFFDIPEDSDCLTTDVPRTTTSVELGGPGHTVIHCYEPDESSLLWELQSIEEQIDQVTKSEQWVGLGGLTIAMIRGYYPADPSKACGRPCPNYTLVIRGDGSVEYLGLRNVDVIGARADNISRQDVRDLFKRFEDSGFFELPPDLHCQLGDVGATTTTVASYRRTNQIERCHVDDPSGRLDELKEIEALIDDLADSQRWVGETE